MTVTRLISTADLDAWQAFKAERGERVPKTGSGHIKSGPDFGGSPQRVNVTPEGCSTSRCTRLCTGSQMKALPENSAPSSSSRWIMVPHAEVMRLAPNGSLNRVMVWLVG